MPPATGRVWAWAVGFGAVGSLGSLDELGDEDEEESEDVVREGVFSILASLT